MKLAHLILTHANPKQLQRLVDRLMTDDTHCYIHVDSKAAIDEFKQLAERPGVYFVANRVKVSWGGYSIVQATVNGFEEIINSGHHYDHINLLSGQDYPVKDIWTIHRFLGQHPGKVFMHALSVMDEWTEAIPRVEQYYLTHYRFPGSVRLERLMTAILPKRRMPLNMVPMGRSQWFTATHDSVRYIVDFLKEHKEVERFFKLSWAPDELIFQTILWNSPFRKDIVNDNLLYVDWSGGGASPKVLTMEDLPVIERSGKLFARKFNAGVDANILDQIDKTLLLIQ
jgi:hypothetical protein